MTIIPLSDSERWDEAAEAVRKAKGKWVLIGDGARRPRNEKAREALERRDLTVEVQSRFGRGLTTERPWSGWRTWARTI